MTFHCVKESTWRIRFIGFFLRTCASLHTSVIGLVVDISGFCCGSCLCVLKCVCCCICFKITMIPDWILNAADLAFRFGVTLCYRGRLSFQHSEPSVAICVRVCVCESEGKLASLLAFPVLSIASGLG